MPQVRSVNAEILVAASGVGWRLAALGARKHCGGTRRTSSSSRRRSWSRYFCPAGDRRRSAARDL